MKSLILLFLFIITLNSAFSIAPELTIGKMYVLNEFLPDDAFVPLDFFSGAFSSQNKTSGVRTLLWFNASNLVGTKIENAALFLFVNFYDYEDTSMGEQVLEIYKIKQKWDNATWNNQPLIDNAPIAELKVYETYAEQVDLTKLVQEWTDNPNNNFGILLKSKNEQKINLKAFTLASFISVNYSLKEEPQNECEANNGICGSECFQNEEEKSYSCGFFNFGKCCVKKPKFCNNDSICDSKETKESCPDDCKDIFELKCSPLPLPKPEEKPAESFEAPPEPPNLSAERKGYIIEFKDEALLSKKKELIGYLEQLRNKAQNHREEAKSSFVAGKIYNNIAAYYLDYRASIFNKKIPKELIQYSKLLENNQKISLNEIKKEIKGKNALRVYKNAFNGIFMDVSEEEANSLKKLDFVKNIYPNLVLKPLLNESVPLIGAGSALESAGFGNLTGKNVSIAIIDTGVDYTHTDLGATKINYDFDFLRRINGKLSVESAQPNRFQISQNNVLFADVENDIYSYNYINQTIAKITQNQNYGYISIFLFNDSLVSVVNDINLGGFALVETNLVNGEQRKILTFKSFGIFEPSFAGNYLVFSFLGFDNLSNGGTNSTLYVYNIATKEIRAVITNESGSHGLVNNGKLYYNIDGSTSINLYDLNTNSTLEYMDIGAPFRILDSFGDEILINRFDEKIYEILNTKTGRIFQIDENLKFQNSSSAGNISASGLLIALSPLKSAEFNDKIVVFEDQKIVNKFHVYDRLKEKFVSFANLPFKVNDIQLNGNRICFSTLKELTDAGIYCFDYEPEKDYVIPNQNIFNPKVIGGYDFANNDNDPMDDNGHGTHVAATAAGNGTLKGVAPGAKIYAYKVFGSDGFVKTSDIIAAIDRSIDPNQDGDFSDHADIISMSLGGPDMPDNPQKVAVSNAVDNGVTAVIAAGNSGPVGSGDCRFFDKSGNSFSMCSPGTSASAITVGASSKENFIAGFSSRGPTIEGRIKPDIVAPGKNICAAKSKLMETDAKCIDNQHIAFNGTSMATPHVSGAAALLKQAHPEWKPSDIKSALMLTAVDLGSNVYSQGSGLINVLSALNAPFLVNNSNIFIGEIEGSATASIEFKNIKDEEILISLSLSNITNVFGNGCNSIKAALSNYTILIPPKKTATVDLRIQADDMDGIFNGFIIAEHDSKKYRIPYSFAKFANQSQWFNSDISIMDVKIGKSVIDKEDTINITIQNIGERMSKSSTLTFEDFIKYAENAVAQRHSDSINPLKAGEETFYYLNWTPQSSGEHTLRFSLETENDKDKTNNVYEVNPTVLVKGIDLAALLSAPDFAVLNFSYKLLVAVHNLGTEPASGINIKVYETAKNMKRGANNIKKEIYNRSFDFVDSEDGKTEIIRWTPIDVGASLLEVNATAPNDNNTMNNYYGTEVNVIPKKPDLKVDLVAFPFYIINATGLVSAAIENLGFNAAENITIEFYENSTLINFTQMDNLDGAIIDGAMRKNPYFTYYKYTPTTEGDKLLRLIAKVKDDADYSNNEKNITITVLPIFKSRIEVKNSSGNISGAIVGIGGLTGFLDSAEMELLQNKVNISVFEELGTAKIENGSAANIEKGSAANFITVFEDSLLQENMTLTVSNYSGVFKGNGTLLYSIYAKNANWSYSKINLINLPGSITYRNASGSYQLFKCKVWDFGKESCTTGWEESVEIDDNINISFSGSYDAIGFGGKDYDGDNLIDLIDNDDDNDGLNDSVDKINCRSEKITVPKRNFSIFLFDNKNLSSSSSFQRFWELRETGKPLIEVNLEENGKINCKNPVIISDKKQSKNFLVVNGLEISNSTKTVYLDASGNSTNTSMICIKDREIAGIDEISDSCNGEGELILKCNGKNRSGYACVLSGRNSGQNYRITGLLHSGVIELGACRESWQCSSWSSCSSSRQTRSCTDINECGTNTSKPAEMQICSEAAAQSGALQSSQSYSTAGNPFYICNREWKCNDWSACANGIQARGCEYVKAPQHASEQACPTESSRPLTTQKCEMPARPQEKTGACFDGIKNQNEISVDCGGVCKPCQIAQKPELQKSKIEQKNETTQFASYAAIAAGVSMLLAITIFSVIVIRKKSKISASKISARLQPLESYVRANLALGYTKAMIRQRLLQAGWKEEIVDNVLKKF